MVIEKHFIKENVQKLTVRKYIEDNLSKVGCGSVDISRSPLGMRVTIHAEKPGLIIGRKGKSIQKLTETLQTDFKLENPQIEVLEIQRPELNGNLMAQRIANAIERGIHFRRAVYSTMKMIESAGALGVQVTISGKISGERARVAKFTNGFIKHSGEAKERFMQEGFAVAKVKQGVMGVQLKLTPPDSVISEIQIKSEKRGKPEVVAEKPESKAEKPEAPEKAKAPEAEAKKAEKPEAKKAEVKAEVKEAPKAKKPAPKKAEKPAPVKKAEKPAAKTAPVTPKAEVKKPEVKAKVKEAPKAKKPAAKTEKPAAKAKEAEKPAPKKAPKAPAKKAEKPAAKKAPAKAKKAKKEGK